ncbi:aminopeptidase [Occallatibacter savannae]|uniref:aminopeptidase n=1 Tax=Occallatibacter savannae TaxID=1002691 RepID=UPI0013A52C4C|nr:aminopeptidase [Occallatibacter savannae]
MSTRQVFDKCVLSRLIAHSAVELIALLLVLIGTISRSDAQELTPEQRRAMAHKIVAESAVVKPHELVVIQGNSVFAPLMEDIAVEASKAGGFAVLMPNSDSLIRSVLTEVPDEYLGQPDPTISWIKNVDVYINLPGIYDEPKVMADVPTAKQAKLASANQNEYMSAFHSSKARSLYIDAPVPSAASLYGFDVPAFSAMQWQAISTGESNIQQSAKNIADALRSAKSVHVTTADGTDFIQAGIHKALCDRRSYSWRGGEVGRSQCNAPGRQFCKWCCTRYFSRYDQHT